MNGWECLAKLKSREKYQQIPVIIYTTSSRSVDRVIAKDLGAICLFTKLHDFKKLKKMLKIVVDKMDSNAVDSICDTVYQYLKL